MINFKITESPLKKNNILYVYSSLGDIISQLNCRCNIKNEKNRCELNILVPKEYRELFKQEIEDKIADCIAVNYKYSFFKKNIRGSELSELEYELLLTSLISADIDEDKKYSIRRLHSFDEYAIDGIFNFRMKPLKEKWQEIISYIPTTFNSRQLKDFIIYLIKDKMGKKVYFENGNVYDKRYNLLKRRELMCENNCELPSLKEILLSGAGEIELGSPISKDEEGLLKELYGDRVIFSEGYFN